MMALNFQASKHKKMLMERGCLTPQIATKPHGGLFFCTNNLFVYCIIK